MCCFLPPLAVRVFSRIANFDPADLCLFLFPPLDEISSIIKTFSHTALTSRKPPLAENKDLPPFYPLTNHNFPPKRADMSHFLLLRLTRFKDFNMNTAYSLLSLPFNLTFPASMLNDNHENPARLFRPVLPRPPSSVVGPTPRRVQSPGRSPPLDTQHVYPSLPRSAILRLSFSSLLSEQQSYPATRSALIPELFRKKFSPFFPPFAFYKSTSPQRDCRRPSPSLPAVTTGELNHCGRNRSSATRPPPNRPLHTFHRRRQIAPFLLYHRLRRQQSPPLPTKQLVMNRFWFLVFRIP